MLNRSGVLKKVGATKWAMPSFIIPKKDHTVQWITDLRELNKVTRRHVYLLPNIQDILRRQNGYNFFTKLDVSMQYYTIPLNWMNLHKRLVLLVHPLAITPINAC